MFDSTFFRIARSGASRESATAPTIVENDCGLTRMRRDSNLIRSLMTY